jgi:hypothetical protein
VTHNLSGQNLGGLTLTPGVYGFSSSAQLTGGLTLNALGNPNALFVINVGSTLTTASGASISLINGAQASNVFFKVGSSATLGSTTAFQGDIVALLSITLDDIESGPGWQENIENNAGRRRPRSRDCLELFSVTKARHAVAFGGKSHIEKIANCRIIVDDKYLIADAA